MEFKILNKSATDAEIEFVLTADEFNKAVENAYEKEKGKYSLQGFRKGKVPKKMLEKNYGEDMFYEEAINLSFNGMYSDFLSKNKDIKPYAYPSLSVKKANAEGLILNVKVALVPTVKMGAYKNLDVAMDKATVSEKTVTEELGVFAEKLARIEETDKPSKNGSVVTINFKGFVDGEAFDGGEAENYDLELGSKSFIPGFEDQLIGLKKDAEKDVVVTFPKDYGAKHLAGKEATFKCKVLAVKEKILPEINDDLAKDASEFNTLADLKADIKAKKLEEQTKKAEAEWQRKIVDKIIESSTFTISKSAISEEAEYIISDLEQNLAYQGLNLQLYCQYLNIDEKTFRENQITEAEKLIKMRLVFNEIIKNEKIDASKQEMIEHIKKQNKNANFDDAAAEKYFEKVSQDKKEVIKNDTIVDKLINFLKTNNLK